MPRTRTLLMPTLLAGVVALSGCITKDTAEKGIEALSGGGLRPDSLPTMLNMELPFRYPQALYDRQVQGNVTLRVYIDSAGTLVPDSTSVAESSGYPGLDSAAVKGSEQLRFAPAKKGSRPIPVSVLLPVYFRHPDAAPLPGDTVLRGRVGVRRPGAEKQPGPAPR